MISIQLVSNAAVLILSVGYVRTILNSVCCKLYLSPVNNMKNK